MGGAEIKRGSVVQLKSGGAVMTVVDTFGSTATVVWLDTKEQVQTHTFPFSALDLFV